MKKLGKIILGIIRTVVAPVAAYLIMYLLIMMPLWAWGWAARPISFNGISIIQIVLIIIGAFIALNLLGFWIMGFWMLPGFVHRAISPRIKWLRITSASLLSVWIIHGQIIIAPTLRVTDGTGGSRPATGLIIYLSACVLISAVGLMVISIMDD